MMLNECHLLIVIPWVVLIGGIFISLFCSIYLLLIFFKKTTNSSRLASRQANDGFLPNRKYQTINRDETHIEEFNNQQPYHSAAEMWNNLNNYQSNENNL